MPVPGWAPGIQLHGGHTQPITLHMVMLTTAARLSLRAHSVPSTTRQVTCSLSCPYSSFTKALASHTAEEDTEALGDQGSPPHYTAEVRLIVNAICPDCTSHLP